MTILRKHPMTAGRLLRSVGVAAILGGLAVPAQSADFWMSRVTVIDGGKSRSMTAAQFALESPLMTTSATAVFDLSISLEEDPQGDDQYPEDPGAADADQNKYEAKIEEFADAVYQATGYRCTELPLTPEKILRATGKM